MKNLNIVIITGHSGSGKSTALAALEDAGYYCVDNMPVALLPKFLELPIQGDTDIGGLAFVMDLREKGFLTAYSPVFDNLKQKGYRFKIIFLEADDHVLVKRYSQTRRYHPLSQDKTLIDGIRAEKSLLKDLRRAADLVIDTSQYNVHDLKSIMSNMAREGQRSGPMRIQVMSFGFKFGVPEEADLIVDVRFLANPYFVPHLQPLDGRTQPVREFVLKNEETRLFLEKYSDLLGYLIPRYEREGKSYLTVAIGCTGGKHRSVAIAQEIYNRILSPEKSLKLIHRDIDQ